ncbi:hypothetical protein MKEN_00689600 [Mycena kentingensis (nom. inval.)]|nr:hypothetical protein MKEN_00689600 [Mycena kentingensis (nom. inval.)]
MIRRNPTLINMTDFDVQDVREMLLKRKADAALLIRMKQMATNPTIEKEDLEMLEQLKTRYNELEKDSKPTASSSSS